MGAEKEKITIPARVYVIVLVLLLSIVTAVAISISQTWGSGSFNIKTIQTALGLKSGYCGDADAAFRFLNVGNADCSVICTSSAVGMIDVGPEEYAMTVYDKLLDMNVEALDFVVISHPHEDHAGGYSQLLEAFPVHNLLIPAYEIGKPENEDLYDRLLILSQRYGVNIVFVKNNTCYTFSDISLTCYFDPGVSADSNEATNVVWAKAGGVSCLYAGDATHRVENHLLDYQVDIRADILKVAHHGSASVTSPAFVSRVRPDYAVISVGANAYGHPTDQVLQTLENKGVSTYRTDVAEQIEFLIKDGKITPSVKGE